MLKPGEIIMDRDREEAIIPASGPLVLARYSDGTEYPVIAWLIERHDYDIGTKDEGSWLSAEGLVLQQGSHHLLAATSEETTGSTFVEYIYGE